MLESMNMRQLYEAVESDEGARRSFMKELLVKFRDSSVVDLGLDLLGLFGGGLAKVLDLPTGGMAELVAAIPDLINAFRRFARGDKFGGALSLICAIPFAGDAAAAYIAGKKLADGGTKSTLKLISRLGEWAKEHRDTAKSIQTNTEVIADVVAKRLPGMGDHRDDIVNAVASLTSGDKEKMIALAKQSGMRIAAREAGLDPDKFVPKSKSDSKPAVAERRDRRSYRLVDLYEGTLYNKRELRHL